MNKKKVLHLRISECTIVGCIDVANNKHVHIEGKPLSSIVSLILEQLIDSLIQQNYIPHRTPIEISTILHQIKSGKLAKGNIEIPIDTDILDNNEIVVDGDEVQSGSIKAETTITDEEKSFIQATLNNIQDPDISISTPSIEDDSDEGDDVDVSVNLESLDRVSIDEIKSRAPDDRYVLLAGEDEFRQTCLEYIYANIPESMWGSDEAGKMLDEFGQMLEKEE